MSLATHSSIQACPGTHSALEQSWEPAGNGEDGGERPVRRGALPLWLCLDAGGSRHLTQDGSGCDKGVALGGWGPSRSHLLIYQDLSVLTPGKHPNITVLTNTSKLLFVHLPFPLCVPRFLNTHYHKCGQKNIHFIIFFFTKCQPAQIWQCVWKELWHPAHAVSKCRAAIPAGFAVSSGAATAVLCQTHFLKFLVYVGKKNIALGRKGIIPGAWLWWKCCAGISFLPAHAALAMCWEEPWLYRVRLDYFSSHAMKNSRLSQRPASVLLALERRMLASRSWMDFCPLRVFSGWELRLAGGKRLCMGRAGHQRRWVWDCSWKSSISTTMVVLGRGSQADLRFWAESHSDPASFCGAAQHAQNR